MTKDNLVMLAGLVVGLILFLVGYFLPTQATMVGELAARFVIPIIGLVIAIWFPTTSTITRVAEARARGKYYDAVASGALKPKGIVAAGDSIDETTIEGIMNWIKKELDSGAIPYVDSKGELLPVPIAPQLLRQLNSRWNNPDVPMEMKMKLLQMTIDFASRSFKETTNLAPPVVFSECDDIQEFWFKNKPKCGIQSAALFRVVLAPIRDALKIRDTGAL